MKKYNVVPSTKSPNIPIHKIETGSGGVMNDEIIKILIRNGADVSRVNKYGKTPLENYTKFAKNPDLSILKNLEPLFLLSSHLKEI